MRAVTVFLLSADMARTGMSAGMQKEFCAPADRPVRQIIHNYIRQYRCSEKSSMGKSVKIRCGPAAVTGNRTADALDDQEAADGEELKPEDQPVWKVPGDRAS